MVSIRIWMFCMLIDAYLDRVSAQCPFFHPNPQKYMYRTENGTFNNFKYPLRGAAHADTNRWCTVPRITAELHDPDHPEVRVLSNILFNRTSASYDPRGLNTLHMQWGQFVNHDISLVFDLKLITPQLVKDDIIIPEDDKHFPPNSTMLFRRVDGIDKNEAENHLTAWLDASVIYGESKNETEKVRDPVKRHLILLLNNSFPPTDERGLFVFAEPRANMLPLLTALHMLFIWEHNWIANTLKKQHPEMDDDTIFNEARILVEAEIQAITYEEWLPALVGEKYNEQPYSEESYGELFRYFNILFRMGHSMVPDMFDMRDPATFKRLKTGPWKMCDPKKKEASFFKAGEAFGKTGGIGPSLAGSFYQLMENTDLQVGECMRNHLFRGLPIGSEAADIVALSVARGRDLGLPNYVDFRKALLGDVVTKFSDITNNTDIQNALEKAYNGKINKVEVYTGMLAEDHAPGASVGPMLKEGILLQFSRLQRADRFWYRKRMKEALGHLSKRSKFICKTIYSRAKKDWCNMMCNQSPRISYCNKPAWCICEIDRVHELRRLILSKLSTLRSVIQRNTRVKRIQRNPFVVNNNRFAEDHIYKDRITSYEPPFPVGDS